MEKLSLILLLLLPVYVTGQNIDSDSLGKVEVISDYRVDKLIRLKTDHFLNDSTDAGFRIQIFATPDRKTAAQEEEKFKNKFPNISVYPKYDSPNFKLRVGDFSSRLEAQPLFIILAEDYPQLFLVPDRIYPAQPVDTGNKK